MTAANNPGKCKLYPENIPDDLKGLNQWVCWRWEPDATGKLTKPPINARTGRYASSSNSSTWVGFDEAFAAYRNKPDIHGIGFVFTPSDPYAGVDLDDCFDAESKTLSPTAMEIIQGLNSYAELSPSTSGVKVYVKASLPDGAPEGGSRNDAANIEIYDKARYFCVTGHRFNGLPHAVEDRKTEFQELYFKHFGRPSNNGGKPSNQRTTSQEGLFQWDGKIDHLPVTSETKRLILEGVPVGDRSQAMMTVCNALVFSNLSDAEIFQIFEQHPIGDKWRVDHRSKRGWLQTHIDKARSRVTDKAKAPKAGHKENTGKRNATIKASAPPVNETTSQLKARLEQLNAKHAVVMIGGKCVVMNEITDPTFNRHDISFSSVADFRNIYLPEKVFFQTEKGTRAESLAKLWLESPYRRQYKGIVFSPQKDIPDYYNLFRGFAVEPRVGDWSLIRQHILETICKNDGDLFVWVLAWIADLFQNPGNEMAGTCIVLRGKRGTGKGCFVSPIAKIVGNHALHIIHQNQLTGRFNNHLKDALLVFADECFWAGDKTSEGVLKGIITNPTITVEPKGKDCFPVKNHVRLIVASNEDWVVPAGLEERRFCVLDVSDEHMQDHRYFEPLFRQIEHGGAEGMLNDLLQMDITSINLREAPKTEALMDQIENTMDTATRFWFERLMDGTLRRTHGRWQEHVLTDDFYDDYITISNQTGRRHCLAKNAFVKKLKSLCPGIFSKQVTGGSVGERPRALFFPPLDSCRNLFQTKVGMKVKWDVDDESVF